MPRRDAAITARDLSQASHQRAAVAESKATAKCDNALLKLGEAYDELRGVGARSRSAVCLRAGHGGLLPEKACTAGGRAPRVQAFSTMMAPGAPVSPPGSHTLA